MQFGARELAERENAHAAKPDRLLPIPKTHTVKGESLLHKLSASACTGDVIITVKKKSIIAKTGGARQ